MPGPVSGTGLPWSPRAAWRWCWAEIKGSLVADDDRGTAVSGEDMLRQEYAHVLGRPDWRASAVPLPELIASLQTVGDDKRPAALCLSGGGIRSATFGLGVLQWLARRSRLQDFHYLSTVSGGGYIGSFLVNGLWQAEMDGYRNELRRARETDPVAWDARAKRIVELVAAEKAEKDKKDKQDKNSPKRQANRAELCGLYRQQRAIDRCARDAGHMETRAWLKRLGNSAGTEGSAKTAGANRISGGVKDPVAPLRAYSNYLSPTGGLSADTFSLVAIFLRNLLLNLLVWLPLLAVVVALPRLYIALLSSDPPFEPGSPWAQWLVVAVAVFIIVGIAYVVADLPAPLERKAVPTARPQSAGTAGTSQVPTPANLFRWVCFWPITLAAVLLSVQGAWVSELHAMAWWHFALAGMGAHVVGATLGVPWRVALRKLGRRRITASGVLVVAGVGALGGALTSLVLSELGQGALAPQLSAMQRLVYATFSVPAMTGAFWLSMALYAGLVGRSPDSSEEDREWWARATAAWLKFTLVWVAAFGLVAWLPLFILAYTADAGFAAAKFGAGGSALGVLTALLGYWSKRQADIKSRAQGFIRVVRAKLLDVMAGLVLLAVLLTLTLTWHVVLDRCHGWGWGRYVCSTDLHSQTEFLREQVRFRAAVATLAPSDVVRVLAPEPDPVSAEIAAFGDSAGAQVYAHTLLRADGTALSAGGGLLLLLACFMAWRMGANNFSLHGMYGNRLVRAYLGSGRHERRPHWFTGFDPADNPKLADLGAPLHGTDGSPRLFPLINIALNLVKPSQNRRDWQQRKAASFFTTPLHCGSAHLGFRHTRRYAGGVSLGRAMTISGAAASPNMGYHSSPLVTAVMTLFNVRLGWWSPNPVRNARWAEERSELGVSIMLAEFSGASGDEDPYVYLSDGGHFDNTGIYEMVRRRCCRIVFVDATCDGDYKWADLLDVVRKIRVDFGVPIEFDGPLPGPGRPSRYGRMLKGRILYSARDANIHDGELIVLKPLLRESDPPELTAYARDSARPDKDGKDPNRFPHHSTADQFYDEQQFESYRLLGYITANETLGNDPVPGPAATTGPGGQP